MCTNVYVNFSLPEYGCIQPKRVKERNIKKCTILQLVSYIYIYVNIRP
jgi:hypothetical protein